MKISYNWLNELVALTLSPVELREALTMAGLAVEGVEEVGDDHILDLDLTSNRPDALSHLGVAREAVESVHVRPQILADQFDEKARAIIPREYLRTKIAQLP